MPISFFHPHEMESYSINDEDEQHRNLLKYIAVKEKRHPSNSSNTHNISLILETKFVRSKSIEGLKIQYANDSENELRVTVSAEEQFRKKYPWNWTDHLKPKLKKEIPSIRFTYDFWKIKRELEKEEKYAGERPLDWSKPTSMKKTFYSPDIVARIKEEIEKNDG